jgi:hypothetical protein
MELTIDPRAKSILNRIRGLIGWPSVSSKVFALPPGARKLTYKIARCTAATPLVWPDVATTIHVQLWLSCDDGDKWREGGSFTACGGVPLKGEMPETCVIFDYGDIDLSITEPASGLWGRLKAALGLLYSWIIRRPAPSGPPGLTHVRVIRTVVNGPLNAAESLTVS